MCSINAALKLGSCLPRASRCCNHYRVRSSLERWTRIFICGPCWPHLLNSTEHVNAMETLLGLWGIYTELRWLFRASHELMNLKWNQYNVVMYQLWRLHWFLRFLSGTNEVKVAICVLFCFYHFLSPLSDCVLLTRQKTKCVIIRVNLHLFQEMCEYIILQSDTQTFSWRKTHCVHHKLIMAKYMTLSRYTNSDNYQHALSLTKIQCTKLKLRQKLS